MLLFLWICLAVIFIVPITCSSSDEEGGDDKEVDSNDPEEMFQNIQYQKEIIANIRSRPWPMRRKLKVLKYPLFRCWFYVCNIDSFF